MQYFYDKQIRRYIQQFLRLFNNFSVQMGHNEAGEPEYLRVPIRYASKERMTSAILKNNSENVVNTVPLMVGYVSNMQMTPEMRMYQHHEEKVQVYEKKFNYTTDAYEDEVGQTYTVERHMPVPYKLLMNLDIWTSNMDQKLQLFEQIMVVFNPTLNIKSSNNPLDWSSLTYVNMTEVNFTTQTVPLGTDDVIDVGTLTFEMPIFINPPAKVRKQTIIHTILTDMDVVATGELEEWEGSSPTWDASDQHQTYVIVTHENYHAKVADNGIQLLGSDLSSTDANGDPLSWATVLKSYGKLSAGISQLRFRNTSDPADSSADILGTISFNSGDVNLLDITFDTDTYPATTLTAITAIVDPKLNKPDDGTLPDSALGQRYLITNDLPAMAKWSFLEAKKNDIIEYNGSDWIISFDASATSAVNHVLNNADSKRYKWTGTAWVNAIEGTYKPGYWRIYL